MPTQKELEQIEKAKSSLKEILKVHMREPINDPEFHTLFGNMKRLKKNGCDLFWTEDITLSLNSKKDTGKLLGEMMGDGYVTLTCPQIKIRILYSASTSFCTVLIICSIYDTIGAYFVIDVLMISEHKCINTC